MSKARKKAVVFDESIDGLMGRFQTEESFELNYILASLPIDELKHLNTASDALSFDQIDFEEMIQRDVDYERVEKDIIGSYLEKGVGRSLFFPPLIVSVIVLEGGTVKSTYDNDEANIDEKGIYSRTWDNDKFRIELELSEGNEYTGYSLEYEGDEHNYHHYTAAFKYNSKKVKLIVIDGQHRFVALKRLSERQPTLLSKVEVPICIVFSPEAVARNAGHESVQKDLRELFVTINSTAKEVSGHFIILLKDKSLSAMAVRSLANYWKKTCEEGLPYLHLLEWNERNNNRATRVNRNQSVTTVSIVFDTLVSHLFRDKNLTFSLLNLQSRKSDLEEIEGSVSAYDISEENFSLAQHKMLNDLINQRITPSLDILFRKPTPYELKWTQFKSAVSQIDAKVDAGVSGYKVFRNKVLGQYRRTTAQDDSTEVRAEQEFDNIFDLSIEEKYKPFYLNVFQLFPVSTLWTKRGK